MRKVLSAAAVVVGLSVLTVAAFADDNVTVRLKWFHQAQFAGYYVAQEQGYYKEAGLNVNVQPGGPDFPAIQLVAGGSEQFGVTSADQILIARSKGVPVVAVAVLYRDNPFVLFSKASSGITGPAQFAGKTVGVKLGGNEELIYRALLQKAGVSNSTFKEFPAKFDLTPFLTGQVDVWPGYTINEVLEAREKGVDVTIISPKDYGLSFYADTLFTTEKMIKEHPDVVKRFVQATVKGWNEAVAHPEEAAADSVKVGTKLTLAHELAMMKASIPLLKPDSLPIGSMDKSQWSALENLLLDGKFMSKPVPVDQAFDASFLNP